MRIIAIFISLLLTANFVHAKVYNCKFADGFNVTDFEYKRLTEENVTDVALKEEGPIAIITQENHEGTPVPKIFMKEKGLEEDIYTNRTQMFLFNSDTLKLTKTFTAPFLIGFQLVSYIEYQCEITQNF